MRKQALYRVTIVRKQSDPLVVNNAINVLASTTENGTLRVFVRTVTGKVTETRYHDVVVYDVQRQDGYIS